MTDALTNELFFRYTGHLPPEQAAVVRQLSSKMMLIYRDDHEIVEQHSQAHQLNWTAVQITDVLKATIAFTLAMMQEHRRWTSARNETC